MQQLDDIALWWLDERSDPFVPLLEVQDAVERLCEFPYAGEVYASVTGTRRWLVERVRVFVYYSVDAAAKEILVEAIWHASRGARPPL